MKTVPYLNFQGNCREAMEFYAQVLGGTVAAMFTHGDTPAGEHVGPEWQDLIMHARLEYGEGVLMASDCPPDSYVKPTGIWVSLHPTTIADAERIFAAFAEGGEIVMPIQQTFWAASFGMVNDRFGIPWMINCEKEL